MTEPASSMEFNGDTESEVTEWQLIADLPLLGEYKEPAHWEQYLLQVRSLGFGLISEGWTLMQESDDRYYYYQVVVGNEKDHVETGQRLDSALIGVSPISLMAHVTNLVWVKLIFALVQGKPAAPTPAIPEVETEPEPAPEPDSDPMHYHLYDVHRQSIGIYRTRTEAVEVRGNHLADENTDKYDDDRLVLVGDYEITVCHRDCSIDGE